MPLTYPADFASPEGVSFVASDKRLLLISPRDLFNPYEWSIRSGRIRYPPPSLVSRFPWQKPPSHAWLLCIKIEECSPLTTRFHLSPRDVNRELGGFVESRKERDEIPNDLSPLSPKLPPFFTPQAKIADRIANRNPEPKSGKYLNKFKVYTG